MKMATNALLSALTSNFRHLLRNNSSLLLKQIQSSTFGTSKTIYEKKYKSCPRNPQPQKTDPKAQFKIIKVQDCGPIPAAILDPLCKFAVVVGGGGGCGRAAADHLLCKGARGVVILDTDVSRGKAVAQELCNAHGKGGAFFYKCDIRDNEKFEEILKHTIKKHKMFNILFNDLDKRRPLYPGQCPTEPENANGTSKTILAGLKFMSKESGGSGGVIVNCASILGFMGWPKEPTPVYCSKEAAIETTLELAEQYPVDKTGVRLIALCPTNKTMSSIGLPDIPDVETNNKLSEKLPCLPVSKAKIGTALTHVMATGKTGSVWVVESTISPRLLPREIHFPKKEGSKVDPNIYDIQPCPLILRPPCASLPKSPVKCPPMRICRQPPKKEKKSKKKNKKKQK